MAKVLVDWGWGWKCWAVTALWRTQNIVKKRILTMTTIPQIPTFFDRFQQESNLGRKNPYNERASFVAFTFRRYLQLSALIF